MVCKLGSPVITGNDLFEGGHTGVKEQHNRHHDQYQYDHKQRRPTVVLHAAKRFHVAFLTEVVHSDFAFFVLNIEVLISYLHLVCD